MGDLMFANGFDNEIVLEQASQFVPLCALKRDYLIYLLQQADFQQLGRGEIILERGQKDSDKIFLLQGSVRLEYASGYTEILVAGEQIFALVDELPRPCRAEAHSDCFLLRVDAALLDSMVSWSQITEYLLDEMLQSPGHEQDWEWVKTVLNSNLFFKVPPINARQILDRMAAQPVAEGEVIVRQGEAGHCCYFIRTGVARVFREAEGKIHHLADIAAGRCFGEDALIQATNRNATVEMLTDGILERLEKDDFNLLLVEPQVDEVGEAGLQYLDETPVFIDVRTAEEYNAGHLVLSTNIPLSMLGDKKDQLNPNIPYIMYCDTGRRSRAAACLLASHGFKALALQGGLVGSGMQYQLVNDTRYVLKDGLACKA